MPAGGVVAVFAEVDPLPGPQVEPASADRQQQATTHEGGLDMGRHVIGAFKGVGVVRGPLRDHFVHMPFEIDT